MKPLLVLVACVVAAPFVATAATALATRWYERVYLPMISGDDS